MPFFCKNQDLKDLTPQISSQIFVVELEAVGIQSPSENGSGTYILCVSEVIGHPLLII